MSEQNSSEETTASPAKKPRRKVSLRATVAVAVVTVCTGALFGISANQARTQPSALDLDLSTLVLQRQEDIHLQETQLKQMQEEIDSLVGALSQSGEQPQDAILMTKTVKGPGIRVSLDDAPADAVVGDNVSVDSLVVHQQDIDSVMNALWNGGAEAMTVQGVRISASTPVRCIGNVILVGGSAFAPPYVIEAIGDPTTLNAALNADPQVKIYLEYVVHYGMGWSVQTDKTLEFPALEDGFALRYATPIG